MATPTYTFKRTPQFRKAFDGLSLPDQRAATEAFKKFKVDPFDKSLKTHKINRLSAISKRNVWSATIKGDLKVVFCIKDGQVISMGIGTHDIYK